MSADVLVTALRTAGVARVYAVNEVPKKPTYPYAVLAVSPAAPQVRTLDGSGDPTGRFTVQHFGKSDDSLADVTAYTFAAFDGRELPLDGSPVAWQEITTAVYRDSDDDGVLTITHTYRY